MEITDKIKCPKCDWEGCEKDLKLIKDSTFIYWDEVIDKCCPNCKTVILTKY